MPAALAAAPADSETGRAVLAGVRQGQLLGPLLHLVGDPQQVRRRVRRAPARPRARVEGPAGGGHRGVDVLGGPVRHRSPHLSGGRVGHRVAAGAPRRRPRAVDKHVVHVGVGQRPGPRGRPAPALRPARRLFRLRRTTPALPWCRGGAAVRWSSDHRRLQQRPGTLQVRGGHRQRGLGDQFRNDLRGQPVGVDGRSPCRTRRRRGRCRRGRSATAGRRRAPARPPATRPPAGCRGRR